MPVQEGKNSTPVWKKEGADVHNGERGGERGNTYREKITKYIDNGEREKKGNIYRERNNDVWALQRNKLVL